MSTTAIAVSTMATVQATAANVAAQQAANAARHAECTTMMQGYVHAGATEPAMRAYAQCVDWLYPVATAASTGERIAVALVLVLTILGALTGFRKACNDNEGALGLFMFAVAGAILGAATGGALLLLWVCVAFVFGV